MLSAFIDIVPVTQCSRAVFDAFVNQIEVSPSVWLLHSETGIWIRSQLWGARLSALDKNVIVFTALEPFPQSVFSHGSGSAWPPDRSLVTFPSLLRVEWSDASLDETMASALRQMSDTIRAVAVADGQNVSHAAKYVNYALYDTPLEDIYGNNEDRLRRIKAAIDPEDVMGLAGGFKF
jgi:hypothetical protein